jgi:heavy metal translocating P-type ATPase
MFKDVYKTKEFFVVLGVLLTFVFYFATKGLINKSSFYMSIVIFLLSLPLFYQMSKSIIQGKFGVDILAGLAIVSALLTGEGIAGGIILIMLSGGEVLETYANAKARSSLETLLKSAPQIAKRINAKKEVEIINVNDVKVGDILVVSPMDMVPVNGIVILGNSEVDESMITGEPLPRSIEMYSHLHSGSINTNDVIHIQAETTYEDSTYSSLVRLVKSAENSKAPLVRVADRFSIYFTLIVLIFTGLVFLFTKDTTLLVAILVVATPCPLILAAPIAFISGMSVSAKRGIIVKNGGVFEVISNSKRILFDKTGTLTFGTPKVVSIIAINDNYKPEEISRIAGSLEQLSQHAVARSILQYTNTNGIQLEYPSDFKENYGSGVEAVLGAGKFFLGSGSYIKSINKNFIVPDKFKKENLEVDMVSYIANSDGLIGAILMSDVVRPGVKSSIEALRTLGYKTTLVTGDNDVRAKEISEKLGFTDVYSECLPEHKLDIVKSYQNVKEKVIMVGDGINDAPALAQADAGIALGSHGSSAATDAASGVIVQDNINRMYDLVYISNKTMKIAMQSIFVGIGLSFIAMVFASLGYIKPTIGALIQEAIDVAVILNALRVLNIKFGNNFSKIN